MLQFKNRFLLPRHAFRQPVEEQVNHRRRVQRQNLAHNQSAHNRDAQRPPQLRTNTCPQSQRQTAKHA